MVQGCLRNEVKYSVIPGQTMDWNRGYLPGLSVREDAIKSRRAEKIVKSTYTLCGSGCSVLVRM